MLTQIAEAKTLPPHVAEVVGGMIQCWGGVPGFCKEYHRVYEEAKIGEQRAMLVTVAKLLLSTTEMGASEEQYEQMTPEDLKHRLKQELG